MDMICYEDAYLEGNYHYFNHTDTEKVGLVLIANKTRCGVKKPDPHWTLVILKLRLFWGCLVLVCREYFLLEMTTL